MDALEMTLLFDYYGDLLTERQRMCFDLRHNQDLSLTEIAQELGVSRQGVHDNLSRAEALLRNMEEKTGCVRRDMACRKAADAILNAAQQLAGHSDITVSELARQILDAAQAFKE
ncbi:MAG: HTH domain-containing protein [Oscillospiraceae bacterium]|nr:HTH domain-containing protein [Oscillospiraceae bacterium]